jgi:NAD(P)-dependent dehydrogenase (short-subunit alcohol dehydrogenase family)
VSGKVAVVTGASRGLGLEIAAGLGEAGAEVVITARREEWLTRAANGLSARGIDVLPVVCVRRNPGPGRRGHGRGQIRSN